MKKSGKIIGIIGAFLVTAFGALLIITPYTFNLSYGFAKEYISNDVSFGADFYTDIYQAVDKGMEATSSGLNGVCYAVEGLGRTVILACGFLIAAIGLITLLYFITRPIIAQSTIVSDGGTVEQQETVENNSESFSNSATEIKKYKELLEQGAISQEEFEEKKKELLDL